MADTPADSNLSAELDAAVSMTTLHDLTLGGFYQSAQAVNAPLNQDIGAMIDMMQSDMLHEYGCGDAT